MIPPQPKLPQYMSYRANRKPKYRGHTTRQYAKQAVTTFGFPTRYDIQVFELDDGEWKLLWDVPKGTPETDLPWYYTEK